MKKRLTVLLVIVLTITFSFSVTTRIKDIAFFRGARDNQLFGIGLVVGLNGTGDSGNVNSPLLLEMMKKFGVQVSENDLKSKNTALVMVLADIPPFAKEGMRIDCVVASIADAKSLAGGYLLQTPLYGADGKVYAVAQGSVVIGGEDVKLSSNLQKRYRVVGYLPEGAIVERDIPSDMLDGDSVTILLRQPDITTAARVARAINEKFEMDLAKAIDPSAIKLTVPSAFQDDLITFLSLVEEIEVQPDVPARIVVNERTGTVLFGGDVKLSDFVISYGNFTISVTGGKIGDKDATISNLVSALKAAGATPQDIIAILQVIYESGYITGELIIM
ncbi:MULTISPECIES: flagellar basal body P-ring protein FlgI [unclassified Thermotoga]|uniref:flagellar basal body P-ring protein FlgI n=1 Tax=unclassified Thermotoga TaxID=2631113 RepID=UPI000280EA2A|nr:MULTISPECIES: flagellar basal body P-ring protein FlgI [unclassified Thermotoga]AIY86739.1 flagellar basal body P-ring protein [Thermotoga sp. 2812B]EJX25457.1 flagellar basal body P-ring protein [Thermotoga sp. EMP]